MATLYIDNRPYDVKEGKNLLETCLTLGFDLPYFCWHPAMGSVGACRQCAIKIFKDENDTAGRLVMSCMEPVGKETRISLDHPDAEKFRKSVIEWLMTNHPHDCAVCDEGGSCHLQDMTVMTGHNYRRFEFPKRTYVNQYLGPLINHEMNRCIQCYRCVRFYKDYAGGKDLDVYAAHNHVYFGREKDGILESEFSGNLAEICPTGVFTDKTLKQHYSRKWDFTFAPSVCQHCSLGCNIIAGERYGELRQITSRYNGDVNGYFICDRGRFGYEAANSVDRIYQPALKEENVSLNQEYIINDIAALLSTSNCVGIGSPRASLESNFALQQLVGNGNYYSGWSDEEHRLNKAALNILQNRTAEIVSLKQIEQYDSILILGEDLTNTAPMAALTVRQAVRKKPVENAQQNINLATWHDAALREYIQQRHSDLFILHPHSTKLDEIATQVSYSTPHEIAAKGFTIAAAIDATADQVIDQIATSLLNAQKPLIITGTSLFNEPLLAAAEAIVKALKKRGKQPGIFITQADCNSMGLAMMNVPPLSSAFSKLSDSTLIILETDLYRNLSTEKADEIMNLPKRIIVFDHIKSTTSEKADIKVPVGMFSEADGTIVNNEGRAQRFFQVFVPKNEWLKESWRWLSLLKALKDGKAIDENLSISNIQSTLVEALPQFRGIEDAALSEDFRLNGQKVPRAPHRYSGRTAMLSNENVSEPKPPQDIDSPMSFTMEGYRGIPPSSVTPFFWSPGWNSVQSINKFQIEIGGPLHDGNPGVRLVNSNSSITPIDFEQKTEKISLKEFEWQLVPVYHIFGSEELSAKAPAIAELTPKPYLGLNQYSLAKLNLQENDMATIEHHGRAYQLPVRLRAEINNEVALILFGLPQTAFFVKPVIIKIRPASNGITNNNSKHE
ncbi:NADH-quinone oxidoreductase subunit G [Solitalea longa]|uniref:NADH-quinone oxidoreductase subunit G n=1 Tax=Solitalea longa TaxID=2079460 RepID=A0A2S4ZZK4_9SPHI|nr:NADH-quinone oxidoreductase subunit NuoG [Solitalea longa]POY35724.1 NADH-quinone oxidoreductase subunit G [Solitalea longa]